MEKFEIISVIGNGTYAVVHKAFHRDTHKIYALKEILMKVDEDEGFPSTAIREIGLLKKLVHPRIVRLEEIIHSTTRLVIVLEYVEYDLKKYMETAGGFLSPPIVKVTYMAPI